MERALAITTTTPSFVIAYPIAAMPARLAVERGDWAAAAQLTPPPGGLPFTQALSWYAKALGAARSGQVAAAEQATAELATRQQALAAAARLLAVPDLTYAVAGLHRPVLLHTVGQAIEHGSGSSQRRKADSSGSSAAVGAADAALAVALVRVLDLAPHAHRLNCTPSMNQ